MFTDKKAAIITGGAQGIGKGIAIELLKKGYGVVIAEIDSEAGKETEKELHDFGSVYFIETDIRNEPSVIFTINETVNRFGNIHLLINNAAIFESKPIESLTLSEWNNIIATNLTGAFLCSKYAASHLSINNGSIINISSTRALISEPNTEAYSASKGALLSLTHALAISLAPKIKVNCISPGWIEVRDWKKIKNRIVPEHTRKDKALQPLQRIGTPYDIASMVLYLAEGNVYITGQNFIIDGGTIKRMNYN